MNEKARRTCLDSRLVAEALERAERIVAPAEGLDAGVVDGQRALIVVAVVVATIQISETASS